MADETEQPTPKKPVRSMTAEEMGGVTQTTGQMLAKQPKRSIRIKKSDNPKDPNYETVQINGYTFTIQKGQDVEVPDEVYRILVNANLI